MFISHSYRVFCSLLVLTSTVTVWGQEAVQTSYDPLKLVDPSTSKHVDLSIRASESKRDIPIRIYYSAESVKAKAAPVLLFSHGLGGSREGSPHIGRHWAGRGYIAVFLQHPGSDSSVWKDAPLRERMKSMNNAANAENFQVRVTDVKSVLDQLTAWNKDPSAAPSEVKSLVAKFDLDRIGMSGHSFGAVTTQAVSGQRFPIGRSITDSRIKAAVVLSPSSPRLGTVETAFGKVSIPWLLMTGTKDVSPIGNITVESRLAVYPALPAGNKYEVVLHNAPHSFPSERTLPGERETRNPNHARAVLALSTAFWDAFLLEDPRAIEWINGSGPSSILEKEDSWKHK